MINLLLIVVIAIVLYSLYKSCFCKDTEGFRDRYNKEKNKKSDVKETNVLKEINNIQKTTLPMYTNNIDNESISTCNSGSVTNYDFTPIKICDIPPGMYTSVEYIQQFNSFLDISPVENDYYTQECSSGHYCPGQQSVTLEPTKDMANNYGVYDCPAGTYQDQPGQTTCKPCPPGSYCTANSISPTNCPTATYQDQSGQSTCKPCPPGWVCEPNLDCDPNSPNCGSLLTSLCPKGYYCPGGVSPISCPVNYYCPTYTADPVPCPAGLPYSVVGTVAEYDCYDTDSDND
jgi:hypothetical protein